MKPDVLTIKEVAARLRTNRANVVQMLEAGRLRGFRIRPGSPKSEWRVSAQSVAALANGTADA